MFYCLVLASCLSWLGPDPSISQADFAVVQDPAQNIYDAVVLEDVYEIASTSIQRYRRVRILSENGKSAAELIDPDGIAKKISGRVLTSEGDDIAFSDKTDLVEVLAYKKRGDQKRERILIPPGLTNDCVVEMKWVVPAEYGLIAHSYQERFEVPEYYFVKSKKFILHTFRGSSSSLVTRQVWTRSEENFASDNNRNKRTVTYTNVPALDFYPYGNRYRDDKAHFVLIFKTFGDFATRDAQSFWADLTDKHLQSYRYTMGFSRPGDYKNWLASVKAGMPGDPVKAMVHVQAAFRNRMFSTDLMHYSQLAKVTDVYDPNGVWDEILGKAWTRGYGNYFELGFIFYNIAKDLKLPFKLVFPSDVDDADFAPAAQQPFVLSYNDPYFAVESNGTLVYFVPQHFQYEAGMVPADVEGMTALMIDPYSRKWDPQFMRVRTSGPDTHKMISQYSMTIAEDLKVKMVVQRQVGGMYSAYWRGSYYSLPPEEKDQLLEREWQRNLPQWTVLSSKVEGADDLTSVITEKVALETAHSEDSLSRLVVQPFPNTYSPLTKYRNWPANRTQDIFLNFPVQNVSLTKLQLPAGWKLLGENSWSKQNPVGSVVFKAQQEGTVVTVRRDIVLNLSRISRKGEQDLKMFIAWMEEATNQTLGLGRQGGDQ